MNLEDRPNTDPSSLVSVQISVEIKSSMMRGHTLESKYVVSRFVCDIFIIIRILSRTDTHSHTGAVFWLTPGAFSTLLIASGSDRMSRERTHPISYFHNSLGCCPGNHVYNNGDAGMALHESFHATVSDNVFENNKYGVRLSVGCGSNYFTNNRFEDSDQ